MRRRKASVVRHNHSQCDLLLKLRPVVLKAIRKLAKACRLSRRDFAAEVLEVRVIEMLRERMNIGLDDI